METTTSAVLAVVAGLTAPAGYAAESGEGHLFCGRHYPNEEGGARLKRRACWYAWATLTREDGGLRFSVSACFSPAAGREPARVSYEVEAEKPLARGGWSRRHGSSARKTERLEADTGAELSAALPGFISAVEAEERLFTENRAAAETLVEAEVGRLTAAAPEGFTVRAGAWDAADAWTSRTVTVASVDVILEYRFSADPETGCFSVDGSTRYRNAAAPGGGWYTFDRTGVESSFYVRKGDAEEGDVVAVLTAQIARAREGIARLVDREARGVTVPGSTPALSGKHTPERIAEVTRALRERGAWTYHPAGFGTGYRFSVRPVRGASRVETAVARAYGVEGLYVTSFDAD